MPDRALVLDTHVWVWMINGQAERLADHAIDAIETASERGEVIIPAICVWEVAMLESRGRLSLSRSVEDWVRLALRAPGVRLHDLTPEIAVASTRLPGSFHGDPADRFIVATARATGASVVTCDRAILAYGASGQVAVLDATP